MGQSKPLRQMALIVEDDEQQRDLVATLFEETEFEVVSCESAEAALSVMETHGKRVSVIFTDVWLSGILDGVDLARMAKNRWPDVSVLVTSGAGGERLDYLPKGAVFMPKPWRALDVLVEAERAHAA